jgi:hypothetical protein
MPQRSIIFTLTLVSSWGKHDKGKLHNMIPIYAPIPLFSRKVGSSLLSWFAQPLPWVSCWLTYLNKTNKKHMCDYFHIVRNCQLYSCSHPEKPSFAQPWALYTEPQVRLESLGVCLHSRKTPSGVQRESRIVMCWVGPQTHGLLKPGPLSPAQPGLKAGLQWVWVRLGNFKSPDSGLGSGLDICFLSCQIWICTLWSCDFVWLAASLVGLTSCLCLVELRNATVLLLWSSISSEWAFSSTGITISKCCNNLKGDIVEALQCLKCMIWMGWDGIVGQGGRCRGVDYILCNMYLLEHVLAVKFILIAYLRAHCLHMHC